MLKSKAAKLILAIVNANKVTRNIALKTFDKYLYNSNVKNNWKSRPIEVQKHKYYILRSILASAIRNLNRGYISKEVAKRMISTLVDGAFNEDKNVSERFKDKYGFYPPSFITLSPYAGCNLKCKGCYAASENALKTKLPFDITRRIVKETHDEWGARFCVISGGEPLLYKDNGKTILDLYEEFSDMFFLMYTNGTLITEEVAKKMAQLGNITPAISVEGYEEETDNRRGKGIFKVLLSRFELLRKYGVPFGVSVTATKENAKLLTTEEFYDFYFDKIGATYMWIFQYMPIGRDINTKLMVTPKQRLEMFRMWQKVIKEKQYFVADFWNSGVVSDGCIAYGRSGGYLYIDWNGNIMPCVFVPYYVDNIKDLYANGKSLSDALMSNFFKRGREWQKRYGYKYGHPRPGNWLMPCSIRDHYATFRFDIAKDEVKPEDENAKQAFESKQYFEDMKRYDEEYERLTKLIWEKEFLDQDKDNKGPKLTNEITEEHKEAQSAPSASDPVC